MRVRNWSMHAAHKHQIPLDKKFPSRNKTRRKITGKPDSLDTNASKFYNIRTTSMCYGYSTSHTIKWYDIDYKIEHVHKECIIDHNFGLKKLCFCINSTKICWHQLETFHGKISSNFNMLIHLIEQEWITNDTNVSTHIKLTKVSINSVFNCNSKHIHSCIGSGHTPWPVFLLKTKNDMIKFQNQID